MAYSYLVAQCVLCNSAEQLTVRLMPPTASSRVLVLDGGGVRGVLTLQMLHALEVHRRLTYPVYDEFDMALGTSTGTHVHLWLPFRV